MSVVSRESRSVSTQAAVDGPMAALDAALARDDPTMVIAALDGQFHHGRPGSPIALRQQVGERLIAALAEQTPRESRWIDVLAQSPSPSARQVACLLLASRYPRDRSSVLQAAQALTDDAHWEVREAAAGLLGTLLDQDFPRMRSWLETLRGSRSENQRRAVVLAVKYAARREHPERTQGLLDLLAPLLRDESHYVRRNLGAFTLGDGLLRVDPGTTLTQLRAWSRDRDPAVRWNVAMAFSSAIGSFHWPAARAMLERLARGPEPMVRMGVAKALRRCRQRYPEEVAEALRRWAKDRDRAATVALVGPARRPRTMA
jgi:DNA alkylation repair enzyme/HEAT repeats